MTNAKELYMVLSRILFSNILMYKAMHIHESNKGTKGLQACIKKTCTSVIKSSSQVRTDLIQKEIKLSKMYIVFDKYMYYMFPK